MIEFKNLCKSYKVHQRVENILQNVNLSIDRGERIALLGPSGAGKTTLMNILGLLDTQTSGQYWLEGIATNQYNQRSLAKVRNNKIGFIFQQYHLLPAFSIERNIQLPWRYGNKTHLDHYHELIDNLGLKPLLNKKPDQLSGGQQQRVAIARAMINQPELILADEPTGALDFATGEQVMSVLQNQPPKTTVIIITHNEKIAQRCNRTIKIMDGAVVS